MPLYYRVFIDLGDNKWMEMDSDVISHHWVNEKATAIEGGRDDSDQPPRNEARVAAEFRKIVWHKQFRAEFGPKDIPSHELHYLLSAIVKHWTLKMTIELVRYDEKSGRKVGLTVLAFTFPAQVTRYAPLGDDYYNFNFKITGATHQSFYDE